MFLVPLILGIGLVLPFSTAVGENAKIIDAAVEALEAISSDLDEDWIEHHLFHQHSTKLINALVPVGRLVIRSKDGKLKRESDEFKALVDFKKRTDEIFKNLEERIDKANRGVNVKTLDLTEYRDLIKLPIEKFKNMTNGYIDPRGNDFGMDDFRKMCQTTERSPRWIAAAVNYGDLMSCGEHYINEEEARMLAEQRESVMKALRRLNVEYTSSDLSFDLTEFMDMYYQAGGTIGTLLKGGLDVYNRQYKYYKDAVEDLFEDIRSKVSIKKTEYPFVCPLRAVIQNSFFNYSAVKAFLLDLKKHLIDLIFVSGFCAPVINDENTESPTHYTRDIIVDLNTLFTHYKQWSYYSLRSAWPSVLWKEQLSGAVGGPRALCQLNNCTDANAGADECKD